MKIYTKTGDNGQSSLFGGVRVAKYHQRLIAYGTIDELNAHLGLCLAQATDPSCTTLLRGLTRVQSDLFTIGSHLATPYQAPDVPLTLPTITPALVSQLETWIDQLETNLPPLKQFILPGGSALAAQLHIARTVCRRAERAVVRLHQTEPVLSDILHYLNRLSDVLFVLARAVNHRLNIPEQTWNSR